MNAASTIFGQIGNSVIGNVAKAYIEIEDERIAPSDITVTQERSRSASLSLPGSGVLDNAAQAAAGAAQTAGSAVPGIQNMVQAATALAPTAATKRRFQVKFNPKEITFQASGGNRISRTNFSESGVMAMRYVEMKTRVQIRVPLIFDDYERTETFMMEKFSDPMALLRTGVTSAVSAITKKQHSVRPQVEGLIGALRNTRTRKLTFYWGNMCYKGVLNELDAQYTMFSIEGRPVRAVVNIGFLCSDETEGDGNMGQWTASYQKAFAQDYSKLESVMQNAGNLLNVNL